MKTERKKIRPDYYDEFSCIAGQCPITCCQEWKIAVDADTNRRWKKVLPPDTMPGCAKSQSLDQVSGDVKNCGKNLSTYTCMKDGIRVIRLDEEHAHFLPKTNCAVWFWRMGIRFSRKPARHFHGKCTGLQIMKKIH